MRRSVSVSVLLAVVLATVGCGDDGEGDGDRPYRIGMIAPLTGGYESLGRDHKKAVELAVEEINTAGGLLGRPVELVVRDDRSQPDQSVLSFNEIKGDVDVVIGSAFSNSALQTIPLAEDARLPYLSLAPADEQVKPIRPYTFVVPAVSSQYADRLLQYFQATGVSRVAVAYDGRSSYATAGLTGMQDKAGYYGVTLVAQEEFQTATTDFAPIFAKVRSSGAQAFTVWATGPPAVTVTKQYAASRLGVPLVLTAAQASRLFLEPAGAAAEGVTIASSIGVVGAYLPDGEQKEVIGSLSRSFRALYKYAPPQFAQDGYSAVQLIAAAVRQAKTTNRTKVRDTLENIRLVTPNGAYAYSRTDHTGLTTDFISVNKVDGGTLIPTDWARQQFPAAMR
ncbi:ABC transporter substrate-binding protein [Virgisporangium ochraceum]|uniref:Branched-chain amino acid ABC transporter substrate-binding protein n=1 Tax=Virgisporangium ochraceum TaxID=65505 RepID=A0A8J4A3U7_9ACTN|nr:ABC transporter substrate-binding protein [Virgisporangium ochraceum]GIJ72276.1 branched-chain amino acid ABC transporter substrate-binding protein [Virgisporangium ochraceum]